MMRTLLLTLSLLAISGPAWAQDPQLQVRVDTTQLTVGDRITLQVSVSHGEGTRVAWPDSLDLGPFEVLGGQTPQPLAREGALVSSLVLTLTAFEVGGLEIPSFPVVVEGPGEESTTLRTNPFGIQVTSVGLDEGDDIREVKGPLGIPLGLGRILLILLATILIPALLYALYRRLARDDPESPASRPFVPLRPPHEVALEALEALEGSPLLDRGEVKEFHIQLSDILRVYVEGRFRVPALEMTSGDILAGMAEARVEPSVQEGFQTFLYPCDMVKFAKLRPDAEASSGLLAMGRQLVNSTTAPPFDAGELTAVVDEAPMDGAPMDGAPMDGAPMDGAPMDEVPDDEAREESG